MSQHHTELKGSGFVTAKVRERTGGKSTSNVAPAEHRSSIIKQDPVHEEVDVLKANVNTLNKEERHDYEM